MGLAAALRRSTPGRGGPIGPTADAGTPDIVTIIAAARKNAVGRFQFHIILFILLTRFVPSRCVLKQLGDCLPQLIFCHRLYQKGVRLHPAALGFKLRLIADPQERDILLYPRMLMQKFIPLAPSSMITTAS